MERTQKGAETHIPTPRLFGARSQRSRFYVRASERTQGSCDRLDQHLFLLLGQISSRHHNLLGVLPHLSRHDRLGVPPSRIGPQVYRSKIRTVGAVQAMVVRSNHSSCHSGPNGGNILLRCPRSGPHPAEPQETLGTLQKGERDDIPLGSSGQRCRWSVFPCANSTRWRAGERGQHRLSHQPLASCLQPVAGSSSRRAKGHVVECRHLGRSICATRRSALLRCVALGLLRFKQVKDNLIDHKGMVLGNPWLHGSPADRFDRPGEEAWISVRQIRGIEKLLLKRGLSA